jgi:hypothetical protein
MTPFPYKISEDQMTKAEFDALSDEEAFHLCSKGVLEGDHDGNIKPTNDWDLARTAYQLEFVNA